MSPEFLEERRAGLEALLRRLLLEAAAPTARPDVRELVCAFLGMQRAPAASLGAGLLAPLLPRLTLLLAAPPGAAHWSSGRRRSSSNSSSAREGIGVTSSSSSANSGSANSSTATCDGVDSSSSSGRYYSDAYSDATAISATAATATTAGAATATGTAAASVSAATDLRLAVWMVLSGAAKRAREAAQAGLAYEHLVSFSSLLLSDSAPSAVLVCSYTLC
jgi:hypothetical protein